jgi:fatty-acid desaturase
MKEMNWPIRVGLWIVNLGALLVFVPGSFSWSAVAVMFALWYITGGIGVSLCYHRTLTHRSLVLAKPIEYATALFADLALQGGPISWVATHRKHHAYTDKEGDPHDARRGLRWTHIEWLYLPNEARPSTQEKHRYAADLMSDPYFRFLEANSLWLQVALGIGLFALGGLPWLVWGVFVRLIFVYHITWLVNSASHRFGYRTFETSDKSTNCWWVGLLAWGEGWHNNHHAFPFSARHGMRWFEFDQTWLVIKILAALRLASNVRLPSDAMKQRRLIRGASTLSAS